MAVSSRLIRRRIKSIGNTRKITKAMELVAASKMRRAVGLALASRAYSNEIKSLVESVRTKIDPKSHDYLEARKDSQTALVIVASSDRGLCGGFNGQLLKKTFEFLKSRHEKAIQVVTVGKRAEAAVRRAGYPIVAAFEAISNAPSFERAAPVGEFAYTEFSAGRVDRVFAVYTDYRSAVSQAPTTIQLLPITPEDDLTGLEEEMEEEAEIQNDELDSDSPKLRATSYGLPAPPESDLLFEPGPETVLNALLPRLLETRLYQALLESSASEHSARMMAMRSATDNASDMLRDLTLTFNQARQALITREISEISAGKAAIE